MGGPGRSGSLDRRAQRTWRPPHLALQLAVLALACTLVGLLVEQGSAWFVFAAVWTVLAVVSVVARRRDARGPRGR